MTEVIAPTRSIGTAALAGLGALATLGVGIALVVDPAVPREATPWVLALALVFSAAVALVALRLVAARGGLVVDDATDRVGLGVTSARDRWWLARSAIRGVRIAFERRTERWLVVLDPIALPPVVVAVTDDRARALDFAQLIADRTRLAALDEAEDVRGPLAPGSVRFGVRRGAALQSLLVAFAGALVASGALTLVQDDRFAALVFGPLLVIIGLVLAAVAVVKRIAAEELTADGTHVVHAFTWRRWRWGERRIPVSRARWLVWMQGMRGGYLELTGDDASLVLGSGATARSRMSLAEIAAIAPRLSPPER